MACVKQLVLKFVVPSCKIEFALYPRLPRLQLGGISRPRPTVPCTFDFDRSRWIQDCLDSIVKVTVGLSPAR